MQTQFLDTSSRIVVWTVCLLLDQCRKVFRENQEICTLKIVMINVKHKISKNEMISTNVKARITIICYTTSLQWANWRKLYHQNCWELVWNNRLYKVNLNLLNFFSFICSKTSSASVYFAPSLIFLKSKIYCLLISR